MELRRATVHNDVLIDGQPHVDGASGQTVRPWGTVAMSQADLRGKFVWHELMTPNAQAAAAFYSNVLPWTIESSTVPGYILWMNGPARLAGLMPQPSAVRDNGTPPNWLVYIGTPEVDATVETAQQLGGKLLKVPTDIPGIGRFAVLSDPQGAAFALFTPAMSGPLDAAALSAGRFSWHELATTDPGRALAFYAPLFGWTRGPAHDMGAGGLYQIIEHAGVPIGGLHILQDPSKPPRWLSYVRITGIETVVKTVQKHGGRVLNGPQVVPGGDRVAHIMDPQGGTIALHEPAQAQVTAPKRRVRPAARTARRPRMAAAPRTPPRAKPAVKRAAAKAARKSVRVRAKPMARGSATRKTAASRATPRTKAKASARRRAPAAPRATKPKSRTARVRPKKSAGRARRTRR
ncbi:MAG: VOC family protein [Steroidobacteraceae bacterium]